MVALRVIPTPNGVVPGACRDVSPATPGSRVEHWPTPRARAAPPRSLCLGGCVSFFFALRLWELLQNSCLRGAAAGQPLWSGWPAAPKLAPRRRACAMCSTRTHPPPSARVSGGSLRAVRGVAERFARRLGGSRWSCRGQSSGFQNRGSRCAVVWSSCVRWFHGAFSASWDSGAKQSASRAALRRGRPGSAASAFRRPYS